MVLFVSVLDLQLNHLCRLSSCPGCDANRCVTARYLHQRARANSGFDLSGSINRVPASAGVFGGNVASVGWQVKRCDPKLHMSSRSAEMTVGLWIKCAPAPRMWYHLTRFKNLLKEKFFFSSVLFSFRVNCVCLCFVDVILSPWPDQPDSAGIKVRNIAYTLTLNYSIGPKYSPSTERQVT